MTPEEIENLTPYQVKHVYFRPKKDQDQGGRREDGSTGYQQAFKQRLRNLGKDENFIQQRWEEYLAHQSDRSKAKQARN